MRANSVPSILYHGRALNDASAGAFSFAHDAQLCLDYHSRWSVPGKETHRTRRCRHLLIQSLAWLLGLGGAGANVWLIIVSYRVCADEILGRHFTNTLYAAGVNGLALFFIYVVKYLYWLRPEQGTLIRGADIDRSRVFQSLTTMTLCMNFLQFTLGLIIGGRLAQGGLESGCESVGTTQFLFVGVGGSFTVVMCVLCCCYAVTPTTLEPDLLNHDFLRQRIDEAELRFKDHEMRAFEEELIERSV